MEQFGLRTRIIMGDGLDSLTAGMKKAFVVTDSFMAQSGKVSYVTDKLNRAGVEWQVFSDIAGEPDIGMVTAGTAKITEFDPDTVICLGGGAAIDAAKAIVFIAKKTGNTNKNIEFVAIPTTSGTGSEVSRFAVIIISHMHGAAARREQAGVCHIHGVGAGFLQIRIQQHDLLAHAAKGQSHGAVRAYMPGADDHNFSLIHNAHLEQILYLLYSPPGHL